MHPSEIAYDYWTTGGTLEAIGHRPGFGLNFDPSHMVWQDLDYVGFLWDFRDRIYHVDCKDTKLRMGNGRNGILSSHLPVGRSPSRLGLHLHRSRRHAVGGHLPDAQLHRLRRAHLHRVGGRRHGSSRSVLPRPSDFIRELNAITLPEASFDAAFASKEQSS